MKIDLDKVDRVQFMVHDHMLNGEMVYLIQPVHIGAEWSRENKIFRSSVWNSLGEPVSLGFPKFVNFSEKPEIFPVPKSLDNTTIVEKLDGSLLIVSKYKGNFILRTRGTVDASKLDNGSELELFRQTILSKLEEMNSTTDGESFPWGVSYLFEWVSPINKIVLNYGDQPDWYLVGMVNHEDYTLAGQNILDAIASAAQFKRPSTYTFSNITDLLTNVDQWKGKEGVCIYSNNGQTIHKVKSAEYLLKHRFKSTATLENTLEMFFSYNMPQYQEFESKLVQTFDWECFEMVRGYASSICDASKQVQQIIDGITKFVEPLKSQSRREAAQIILSSYGTTGRSNMAFTLLDSKPLSTDQLKKLYWQCLKS